MKFKQTRLIEPYGPLAEAAAAVGEVDLPEDRDGAIRHTWLYHDDRPSLALAAYEVATGDRSLRDGGARLIAYYGKPRRVPTVSAYQALEPEEYLAPGYFKDKIVFVGASEIAAVDSTEEKDSFRTPFFGGEVGLTWGVEIHANVVDRVAFGFELFVNLKLLEAENDGVDAAFVLGGLKSLTQKEDLASLGSLFFEPLWIFHRPGLNIEHITDMKGMRLGVGREGG